MKKLRIWLLLISVTTSLVGADAASGDESDQGLVLKLKKTLDIPLGDVTLLDSRHIFIFPNDPTRRLILKSGKDIFDIELITENNNESKIQKWKFDTLRNPLKIQKKILKLLLSKNDLKSIIAMLERASFEPPIEEEEFIGKEKNSFRGFDETFVHDDSSDKKTLRRQQAVCDLSALNAWGDAGAFSSGQRCESTSSLASLGSSGSIDSKTSVKSPNYLFKLCAFFLAALFIQGAGQA